MNHVINPQRKRQSIKWGFGIGLMGIGFMGTIPGAGLLLLSVLVTSVLILGLMFTGLLWTVSLCSHNMNTIRKACEWMIVVMIIQLFMLPPAGYGIHVYTVRKATAFCQTLIPGLEAEKRRQSVYPDDIALLIQDHQGVPPFIRRALADGDLYQSNGHQYTLSFFEPAGMFPILHRYSSATGQWEVSD